MEEPDYLYASVCYVCSVQYSFLGKSDLQCCIGLESRVANASGSFSGHCSHHVYFEVRSSHFRKYVGLMQERDEIFSVFKGLQ